MLGKAQPVMAELGFSLSSLAPLVCELIMKSSTCISVYLRSCGVQNNIPMETPTWTCEKGAFMGNRDQSGTHGIDAANQPASKWGD